VYFNQATMYQSSETDSATLGAAKQNGHSGAADYGEDIKRAFERSVSFNYDSEEIKDFFRAAIGMDMRQAGERVATKSVLWSYTALRHFVCFLIPSLTALPIFRSGHFQ